MAWMARRGWHGVAWQAEHGQVEHTSVDRPSFLRHPLRYLRYLQTPSSLILPPLING
jgi:hypothetical protein